MDPILLFVYGSLQPGFEPFQDFCQNLVIAMQPAWTRGELYLNPSGYPVLVPASTNSGRVIDGWVLSFGSDYSFATLDQWELLDEITPNEGGYERTLIEVSIRGLDGSERSIDCHAYVGSRSGMVAGGARRQISGNWCPKLQCGNSN